MATTFFFLADSLSWQPWQRSQNQIFFSYQPQGIGCKFETPYESDLFFLPPISINSEEPANAAEPSTDDTLYLHYIYFFVGKV
jgi:hypothetical protein